MSMHLDFEPHSWYMGFAIRRITRYCWKAYINNGNTYQIDDLGGVDLKSLKHAIREYHLCKHNGYGERIARRRLEELRTELRAERISYGELAELWKLREYISDGDTELLEAAGVSEGSR